MNTATVLIALGSNKRHHLHGPPPRVVAAAIAALATHGLVVTAQSTIRTTAPVGPGGRSYANAAIAATWSGELPVLLRLLKALEVKFGRRGGQRWGARVLDLDILAAEAVVYPPQLRRHGTVSGLVVPHPRMADRRFVLDPLCEIAADWRHPLLHLHVRQLHSRACRPKACHG